MQCNGHNAVERCMTPRQSRRSGWPRLHVVEMGNHLERVIAYTADFFSPAVRAITDLYCTNYRVLE